METSSPLVLQIIKHRHLTSVTEGANCLKVRDYDAGEKVVFGKVSESVSGSSIGTLTLSDGSITDSGGYFLWKREPIDHRNSHIEQSYC